jgi:hypothetical protein
MNPLSADVGPTFGWPDAIFYLGVLIAGTFLIAIAAAIVFESRKLKIATARDEEMRQLVRRFEQLAETTLDAQQRAAADLAELRSRTTSIEQILRTVE